MELLQQQVAESPFCNRPADIQTSKLCYVCSKELGSPEIWPMHCKAPMELLQLQVAGSTFCDWPADIQTSKLCYVSGMQQRARQSRNMAKVSCRAPMELLQQQVAESPFSNRPADIQTSKLCCVCSKELGTPEIWPKPAARLQWSFCNLLLQNLHFVTGQQISRPAIYKRYAAESLRAQKYGQSQLQGSNGTIATASCRISILWLDSRYPDQQAIRYMQQHVGKHINMARAGWYLLASHNMEILQLAVAEVGALQLALAIFLDSLALCCIHGIACQSGYLLTCYKMEILQLAAAEAPLEPCSWLWQYFWAA